MRIEMMFSRNTDGIITADLDNNPQQKEELLNTAVQLIKLELYSLANAGNNVVITVRPDYSFEGGTK